jgi:hypothetical protein
MQPDVRPTDCATDRNESRDTCDRGFVQHTGGEASYRIFVSATWRIVFDWVVVVLSFLGFGVALALVRPWGRTLPQRPLQAAAWTAAAILTLRGVAGVAVDGLRDLESPIRPVWTMAFVVGGLLFGGVAWRARQRRHAANPSV